MAYSAGSCSSITRAASSCRPACAHSSAAAEASPRPSSQPAARSCAAASAPAGRDRRSRLEELTEHAMEPVGPGAVALDQYGPCASASSRSTEPRPARPVTAAAQTGVEVIEGRQVLEQAAELDPGWRSRTSRRRYSATCGAVPSKPAR